MTPDTMIPKTRADGKPLFACDGQLHGISRLFRNHAEEYRNRDFRNMVERLTNWQRHQWGRDGWPGLHDRDAEQVRPYTEMVHP